jgi:hypothetical protein
MAPEIDRTAKRRPTLPPASQPFRSGFDGRREHAGRIRAFQIGVSHWSIHHAL